MKLYKVEYPFSMPQFVVAPDYEVASTLYFAWLAYNEHPTITAGSMAEVEHSALSIGQKAMLADAAVDNSVGIVVHYKDGSCEIFTVFDAPYP